MYFGFENEEMMGQRVGEVTYRQLVDLGAVTPYELVVMSVKREDIKTFLNANIWVRDENYFDNEELQTRFIASIILADKAYKKGYTNKLLSFHSRNSHAVNFEKAMIHLKSDSLFTSFNDLDFIGRCMGSQANTNKVLLDFLQESKKGVISNARVLTEGVSVPCIDSVLFCDPKTSPVDLAQGISRSIRLYSGKNKAYILLPVIVDEEGNIENDSYQRMIDLLDYLSGFDELLEDEINIVTQSQNRTRIVSSRVINTNELEVEGVNINDFYNELSLQIWSRVKSRNDFWEDEERLREYAANKTTRNELTEIDAALRRLEANDYNLWKKLAPHIPLPNKGMSEEECAEIALNYKGTYEQFRQDHPEVISRFHGLAEMKSTEYTKGSELIAKYCSHMTRDKIQWKTILSEEVIAMIQNCESKKDVRTSQKNSFVMALKRYEHLKPALDFYEALPATPTGLKVGTRRGGGWKLK
jgi:hypothetical protein